MLSQAVAPRSVGMLAIAFAAAFAVLTMAVGLGWVLPLDLAITAWVAAHRDCATIARAAALSVVGAGEVSLLFTALGIVLCLRARRPCAAASLLLLYLSLPIELGLKLWLPQPLPGALYPIPPDCEWYRPALSALTPHSYPSGYAIRVTYFVVLVGVLLLRADGPVAFASRARLSRVAVPVVLGLVLFLLVGSRLLLSWHWLSDLVGGALLGVALAGASLRVASADAAEPRPAS